MDRQGPRAAALAGPRVRLRDHSHPESSGASGAPGESRRPAEHVWVLTGSIGAPTAVTRLLSRVGDGRSLALVVALRIANDGVPLIARLLGRVTSFRVHSAGIERTLYPGDCLVVPIDGAPEPPAVRGAPPTRSIDEVLATLAERYLDKAGVIVLSGIGAEGIRGCEAITRYGGRVWVQDPVSCEHQSLPRAISEACRVDFIGTPEQLGERLATLHG